MKRSLKSASGSWLRRYTALYLLVALPMLICLLVSGKTLLWRADAFYQHYTALNYTGEMLRSLFAGEGFKLIDLSLGQGLDSITTMAYYGLFDPFQWPAVFLKGDGLEIYYHVLVFGYMYLSGLFFCLYARKVKFGGAGREWAAVAAGLIFAFCGYNTIGVIKHPYFATGGIYLALILIAVERIFQERKWLMMSLITALMLVSNFYFAFQTTVLTVIYILIRLFARIRPEGVKKSAGDGFILLGSYLLGLMLSMAVLLPVAITFLGSSRAGLIGGYTDSLLLYPLDYYVKLILLAFAPYDYAGYWSLQSFSPIALFALMALFVPRKFRGELGEDSLRGHLRAGFIVLFACMCIPLAGKIFNGLGYVANRWSYGYAFLLSIITLWALPVIMDPSFALRRKMAAAGLCWAVLMLGYGALNRNVGALAGGLAVGAAALFLLLFEGQICRNNARMKRVFLLLTAVCCLAYAIGYPVVAMRDSEFYPSGLSEKISNETAAVAAKIDDDSFYRIDTGIWNDCHASFHDYNATSYYWSLVPDHVSGHYIDLEHSTLRWTFRVEGMGSDPYLDALASVGYSLRNEDEGRVSLPYGHELQFTETQADGDSIGVYKNRYALPVGYVFDAVMAQSDYELLDPVQKRQALLRAAVVEEAECGLEVCSQADNITRSEWEIVSAEGVEVIGNEIHAEKDGLLTLRFEAVPDSTAYLHWDGIELVSIQKDNGLISTDNITDLAIHSLSDAGVGRMYVIRRDGVFNYGQTGSCLCLGYSEAGIGECTLRFDAESVIRFNELEVLCTPMANYRDAVVKLQANGWDARLENNGLQGVISLEKPGMLQISLPYSKGWSAEVDGEETEILRCGGMYMGIVLPEGTHEIHLRYMTPGLRAGMCVSAVAALLIAALCVVSALRRKKHA